MGSDISAGPMAPATLLQHGLLTPAQEVELARRWEVSIYAQALLDGGSSDTGTTVSDGELSLLIKIGIEAREAMVGHNLRLVAAIAAESSRRSGTPPAELFQEGVLGLLEAVNRFDHRRGVRLGTWAAVQIRSRVQAAVATRVGQLPVGLAGQLRQLRRTTDDERAGTDAELAQRLGWSRTKVSALRHGIRNVSVDQVLEPADPGAAAAYRMVLDRVAGSELLAQLSPEQRTVVSLRFGIGGPSLSRAAVAGRLGWTPHTVRQLETRALLRLRQHLQSVDRFGERAFPSSRTA